MLALACADTASLEAGDRSGALTDTFAPGPALLAAEAEVEVPLPDLPLLDHGDFEHPRWRTPDPRRPGAVDNVPAGWRVEGPGHASVLAPSTPWPGSDGGQVAWLFFDAHTTQEVALVAPLPAFGAATTVAARVDLAAFPDGDVRPLPDSAWIALRVDGVEVARSSRHDLPRDTLAPLAVQWTVPAGAEGLALEVAVGGTASRTQVLGPRPVLVFDQVRAGVVTP